MKKVTEKEREIVRQCVRDRDKGSISSTFNIQLLRS